MKGDRWRVMIDGAVAIPHHMKNHTSEIGIRVVMMRSPIGSAQIDFDVTALRWFAFKLDHRLAKIRTNLPIPKARMQHLNGAVVERSESVAQQALVKPHGLQETFWR